MLLHEKKHKQKIMNNETMKVKHVFKSYGKHSKWFSACPSWNSKTQMHRTPSSLRGRLDTNNLRTNETKIMNQLMITLGQCTLNSE
jgi:hypothetical protein